MTIEYDLCPLCDRQIASFKTKEGINYCSDCRSNLRERSDPCPNYVYFDSYFTDDDHDILNNGYHGLNKIFYEDLVSLIIDFVGKKNLCLNMFCGSTQDVKDNLCYKCYRKLRLCDYCGKEDYERHIWKYTKERGYKFRERSDPCPKGIGDLTDVKCRKNHNTEVFYTNQDLKHKKTECNCHKRRYNLCRPCYIGLFKRKKNYS